MRMGIGGEIEKSKVKLKWALNEEKRLVVLDDELDLIRVHYVDNNTYLCYLEKGLPCPMCKKKEFFYRMGLNVIEYLPGGKYEVKIWGFGAAVYQDIKKLKVQWGALREHDLLVSCSNDKFQTLKIAICPTAGWKTELGDQAKVLADFEDRKKDVGAYLLGGVTMPGETPKGRGGGGTTDTHTANPVTSPEAARVETAIKGEMDDILDSL